MDSDIDLEKLAKAVEKVVAARPSMEIRLSQNDAGEIYQFIPENLEPYRQTVVQMSEEQWQETFQQLLKKSLHLMNSRLFSFDIVQTERAKYFFLTTHHILFDGVSCDIIIDDISAAYAGKVLTRETFDIIDVAVEENKTRKTEKYDAAKIWYEKTFGGLYIDCTPQPVLYEKDSFKKYVHSIEFSDTALKNFCRNIKVSTSALTNAAFAILMGIYTNQSEVLFSTIHNGRDKDTSNVIGMFVKTLPVYATWNKDTTTKEFICELSDKLRSCREKSIFSFADVSKFCSIADNPIFAWHGKILDTNKFCEKPVKKEILDLGFNESLLSIALDAKNDELSLRIEYNAGKYSERFIKTLAKTYEEILRQLMTKNFIREIEPCVAGTDSGNFNQTEFPVKLRPIHKLFEELATVDENIDKSINKS